MKIAVTYENGQIYQHFGHSEHFKLYEIKDNQIAAQEVVPTNGSGHGALAGFLASHGVNTLICGGIGGGAQMALAKAGIALCAGVSGQADDAVAAYLSGTLNYSAEAGCRHHEHGHGGSCSKEGHSCHGHGDNKEEHSCRSHKEGCSGHSCHD